MSAFLRITTGLFVLLSLLSGCAAGMQAHKQRQVEIGPFEQFTGRLLVLQPNKRWQVQIQWQGTSKQGKLRLTHAASGRIVYLKWQQQNLWLLDNQSPSKAFKHISAHELSKQGMLIAPQTLAAILHGKIPDTLKAREDSVWQGKLHGHMVRLKWQESAQKLTMTDITLGNTAILLIDKP